MRRAFEFPAVGKALALRLKKLNLIRSQPVLYTYEAAHGVLFLLLLLGRGRQQSTRATRNRMASWAMISHPMAILDEVPIHAGLVEIKANRVIAAVALEFFGFVLRRRPEGLDPEQPEDHSGHHSSRRKRRTAT